LPSRNLHHDNETKIVNENGVHHERNVLEEDQGCIDAKIFPNLHHAFQRMCNIYLPCIILKVFF
jgi:hypothetical protein